MFAIVYKALQPMRCAGVCMRDILPTESCLKVCGPYSTASFYCGTCAQQVATDVMSAATVLLGADVPSAPGRC